MKMFDRKAYGQRYSREKRERRKAEGRCVTCGVKLTFKCMTLQCEHCREKQKYQNVAKVNISKLIAEAKVDTVRKMQERFIAEIEQTPNANEHFIKAWKSKIYHIANEVLGDNK
jgi:hypothetical protein